MKDFDIDLVSTALRDAAKDIVLPRYQALADHHIHEKSPGDVVTVADIEAERFLTDRLIDILPGSTTVGEEHYSRDASIEERFAGSSPVWVIDPIDGTRNFANGTPTFCMMVGLIADGVTQNGWVYDPLTDRMFVAGKGAGAYVEGNRLQVGPAPALGSMTGQVSLNCFDPKQRPAMKEKCESAFGSLSNLRCAGHDFVAQTLGERHFALYNRIWMWDHAPGVLILQEAGGYVERIDDTAYRPVDRAYKLLSAPDKDTWMALKSVLTPA